MYRKPITWALEWRSLILQRPFWIRQRAFWKKGDPTTSFASSRRFQPNHDVNPPPPPSGSSRTSPIPCRVYKGEDEAGYSVQLSARTDLPPNLLYQKNSPRGATSLGRNALLEAALAPGMPPDLYQPYPLLRALLTTFTFSSFLQEGCLSWSLSTKPSVAI